METAVVQQLGVMLPRPASVQRPAALRNALLLVTALVAGVGLGHAAARAPSLLLQSSGAAYVRPSGWVAALPGRRSPLQPLGPSGPAPAVASAALAPPQGTRRMAATPFTPPAALRRPVPRPVRGGDGGHGLAWAAVVTAVPPAVLLLFGLATRASGRAAAQRGLHPHGPTGRCVASRAPWPCVAHTAPRNAMDNVTGPLVQALSDLPRDLARSLAGVGNGNFGALDPIDTIVAVNVLLYVLTRTFPGVLSLFVVHGFSNVPGLFLTTFCCYSAAQLLTKVLVLYFITKPLVRDMPKAEVWGLFLSATAIGSVAAAFTGGYYMGSDAGVACLWATWCFRNPRYPLRMLLVPQTVEARWLGLAVGIVNVVQWVGGLPSAAAFSGGASWAVVLQFL